MPDTFNTAWAPQNPGFQLNQMYVGPDGGLYGDALGSALPYRTNSNMASPDGIKWSEGEVMAMCLLLIQEIFAMKVAKWSFQGHSVPVFTTDGGRMSLSPGGMFSGDPTVPNIYLDSGGKWEIQNFYGETRWVRVG